MSLNRAALEPSRFTIIAVAAMVTGVIALAYAGSLRGPLVFDDVPAVAAAAEFAETGSWGKLLGVAGDAGETIRGRPVVALSFALNYALHGERVTGYHVFNLAIHVLAALTLLGGVRRICLLLPGVNGNAALLVASASAALWGVHPLTTAAVTYVVQRAEAMMALAYLLTLYAFLRSCTAARPLRWRAISVVACALGMGTKEVMVSAPLFVLLVDRTWVAGSFRRALADRRAYYGALAGTWLIIVAAVVLTGGRGGTAGFETGVEPTRYLLTQIVAVVHYLRLALWPEPLIFDYGTGLINDFTIVAASAGVLMGLIWATATGLQRRTAWSVAAAGFFAVLAPSSSIVPIASQTIAEHRMYLALAAPIVVAVALVHHWLGRGVWWLAFSAVVAGGLMTHARNKDYQSARRLWTDTVAKRPGNDRAHHNLGLVEFHEDRLEPAAERFQRALERNPQSADAHYNLGLTRMRQGQVTPAIAHYRAAVQLRPAFPEAHNNLGQASLAAGQTSEAVVHFRRALALHPELGIAHANLSEALLQTGDLAGAVQHGLAGAKLAAGSASAHFNAGNALASAQRATEAREHYERAVQLAPDDAQIHNNLANVLIELQRFGEARRHYERALTLAPLMTKARRNLAVLLLQAGEEREALAQIEELVRISPEDPTAQQMARELRAKVVR